MLRIESQPHLEQIPKTAQQQARGDHQHQRQREFRDHQHPARSRLLRGARRSAPFQPERMRQIQPACLPRGSQAEDDAGGHRGGQGEQQNGPVDRYVVEPRQAFRNHAQQESFRAEQNRQTSRSTQQRKQQALGQQLPHQPLARRSQRLANRHLASSGAGPRQQQIRHVHAPNQQHQSHRAQQQHQRLANIADHVFLQRHQPHLPLAVRRIIVRKLFLQRSNQRVHLALRRLNRQSRLQSRDGVLKVARIAGRGRRRRGGKTRRRPQLRIPLPTVRPGSRNPGGITPTTRYTSLSSRKLLPRTCGSLPKARFHNPSLMTTSSVNPGV